MKDFLLRKSCSHNHGKFAKQLYQRGAIPRSDKTSLVLSAYIFSDIVKLFPTIDTRSFRIKSIKSFTSKEYGRCVICLTVFENYSIVLETLCGHYFCPGCIIKFWKNSENFKCPTCRLLQMSL